MIPHPPFWWLRFGTGLPKGGPDLILQVLEEGQCRFRVTAGHRQLPVVAFGVFDEVDPDWIFVGQVPVHHGQAGEGVREDRFQRGVPGGSRPSWPASSTARMCG